jgi:CBS-domain-containing membrane protein
MDLLQKMKGNGQSPPRVSLTEVLWSWVGSFLGIAAVSVIHYKILNQTDLMMIIGSFGASAVLIYGAIRSPLAQPRNLLGGHIISAIVGVTAFQLFSGNPWLAASFAVSTSIALMHLTKTLHPPGGATALIAVIGSDGIHSLGYLYVLIPVAIGASLMLLIALFVNNIPKNRRYPEFWF